MEKEYVIRILECINEHFDNYVEFREAMIDLAMDIFRETILDNYDVYNYGIMLYATLHLDGVKMIVE